MPSQTDVAVVGDGPAGLSAALFLAKNGLEVDVFGEDDTYLHDAYLRNVLGIEEIHGSDYVEIGRRQVASFGATLHEEGVDTIDDDLTVHGADGTEVLPRYLVLAMGPEPELAETLGLEVEDDVVDVDRDGLTSRDDVYAAGWLARGDKVQAAISVGDGAAAALDILSREAGKPVRDFDTPD